MERAETFGVGGERGRRHGRGGGLAGGRAPAVRRAREGGGPGFLLADCYRFYGHGRKDPSPYRTKEEEEAWRQKDPVALQKRRLAEAGLLDEKGVRRPWSGKWPRRWTRRWPGPRKASLPEPGDLCTHVYAE